MYSSPRHWRGFRLEKLADGNVRSMCVIHEKLWCLGRSSTTGKRSIFEKGEEDLGNYELVRLFSVTREVTEGVHWSLFPNTQRTRK